MGHSRRKARVHIPLIFHHALLRFVSLLPQRSLELLARLKSVLKLTEVLGCDKGLLVHQHRFLVEEQVTRKPCVLQAAQIFESRQSRITKQYCRIVIHMVDENLYPRE